MNEVIRYDSVLVPSRVVDCVGILPECQQREEEIAVHQHVSTGWARKLMDYGKMGHGAGWQPGKMQRWSGGLGRRGGWQGRGG